MIKWPQHGICKDRYILKILLSEKAIHDYCPNVVSERTCKARGDPKIKKLIFRQTPPTNVHALISRSERPQGQIAQTKRQISDSLAMEYLIRFAQCHESFRVPEIQAVATLVNVDLRVVSYSDFVSDLCKMTHCRYISHLDQTLP